MKHSIGKNKGLGCKPELSLDTKKPQDIGLLHVFQLTISFIYLKKHFGNITRIRRGVILYTTFDLRFSLC